MAERLVVPLRDGQAEYVEKRSRFIGRVWRCDTEQAALAHIRATREAHWDATHNVYAYRIAASGAMRYSDDGEPQGTSGLPTLEVFRKAGVTNLCCIVTRYFGGVLLGAGGLVRAYSHTAALALEAAGRAELRPMTRVVFACPYGLYERLRRELAQFGTLEQADFGAEVTVTVLTPQEAAARLRAFLQERTGGRVEAIELDAGLQPFPLA